MARRRHGRTRLGRGVRRTARIRRSAAGSDRGALESFDRGARPDRAGSTARPATGPIEVSLSTLCPVLDLHYERLFNTSYDSTHFRVLYSGNCAPNRDIYSDLAAFLGNPVSLT